MDRQVVVTLLEVSQYRLQNYEIESLLTFSGQFFCAQLEIKGICSFFSMETCGVSRIRTTFFGEVIPMRDKIYLLTINVNNNKT